MMKKIITTTTILMYLSIMLTISLPVSESLYSIQPRNIVEEEDIY